jgi:ADP-dependent NAD(P)H-hydrate dehydratase / NAD(P)H-hydrate epimerase
VKLVTVAEMREAEARSGVPIPQLMENAGLAVAQEVWLLLGEVMERRVLVLVGPGNNGGDGLVAARHLHDWGAKVHVYLLAPRREDDPVFAEVVKRQVPITLAQDDAQEGFSSLEEALSQTEVIIDAILGTGRARPIGGNGRRCWTAWPRPAAAPWLHASSPSTSPRGWTPIRGLPTLTPWPPTSR